MASALSTANTDHTGPPIAGCVCPASNKCTDQWYFGTVPAPHEASKGNILRSNIPFPFATLPGSDISDKYGEATKIKQVSVENWQFECLKLARGRSKSWLKCVSSQFSPVVVLGVLLLPLCLFLLSIIYGPFLLPSVDVGVPSQLLSSLRLMFLLGMVSPTNMASTALYSVSLNLGVLGFSRQTETEPVGYIYVFRDTYRCIYMHDIYVSHVRERDWEKERDLL